MISIIPSPRLSSFPLSSLPLSSPLQLCYSTVDACSNVHPSLPLICLSADHFRRPVPESLTYLSCQAKVLCIISIISTRYCASEALTLCQSLGWPSAHMTIDTIQSSATVDARGHSRRPFDFGFWIFGF